MLELQLEDRTGLVTVDDPTPGSPTAPRDPLNPAPAGGGRVDVSDENGNVIGGLWGGYTGLGYLDMGGDVGDAFEFDVGTAVAGLHTLEFRFANGSGFDRPLAVSVGGSTQTVSFPATGSWDTWQVSAVDVTLPAGVSRVRVANTIANGPNLDQVAVTLPDPPVDVQFEDRSGRVVIDDLTSPFTQPRDPLNPAPAGSGRVDVLDDNGNVIGGLWPGYVGEGYLDMGGNVGDAVEVSITTPAAASRTLVLQYANGSAIHRPMDVTVTGDVMRRVDFPPTGGWADWRLVAVDVEVPAGSALVRFVNTVANGPNLDELSVEPFVDGDGDGLSDLVEGLVTATDPTLADTDGDTVPDGAEVAAGTDPNDPSDGPSDDRPNIVLILADDLGWSDIGAYGSEIVTPTLDSLATQGLRFTTFTNTAKCFPSRSSLLTGLYAQQTGTATSANSSIANAVTLGEVLGAAGYRTLMSGKHHGLDNPYDRGFDRSYGLRDGAVNFFNPGLQRPGEPDPARKRNNRKWMRDAQVFEARDPAFQSEFPADFYVTDAFTDEALDYLDTYATDAAPFFLYLAYTAPHDPLQAPASDIARYQGVYDVGYDAIRNARYHRQLADGLLTAGQFPLSTPTHRDWNALSASEQVDEARRMEVYAAMVDRMDQNIGRIVAKLQRLGEFDNTIILFASDNGASDEVVQIGSDPIGTVGRWSSLREDWANVANTPFREYKNDSFMGGIASPLIVHWPQGVVGAGRVVHDPVHLVD
ncbi:MAG: sulfatase-like hydrolase/transferase, partial [Myxococcota bacterium]